MQERDDDFEGEQQADELEKIDENAKDDQSDAEESNESESEASDEQESEESEGDLVVTIGDDKPEEDEEYAKAPKWVKELRRKNREDQKRIRELEEQLKATKQTEDKPVEVGAKPKLDDFDYDTDAYESALAGWYEKKRQADAQKAEAQKAEEAQKEAWEQRVQAYVKSKTELKARDFDETEAIVQDTLSATQQGIIVQGSDNPALIVYALGKNPKRAKELGAITDPVKFTFAVAKLEAQLKVTKGKTAPPPEKTVASGGGKTSSSVDSTLARLRAEAEKTGDYSKVIAHRRKQSQK
jgi:hypothetical protein